MQHLEEFKLPSNFRGKSGWFVQLWWIIQSLFFKTSPQFMYGWRRFLLRLFGAKIGKKVIIRPSAHIQFPWKLTVGDFTWIGDEVVIYNLGEIVLGNNVVVSQRSYLCAGTHDYKAKDFSILSKEIIIEDEVWIATDVFISPGIKIQRGCVVGARSSVFTNLPSNMICIGSPAKAVKERI
ncbi:putative colanic acid biosynthesis acetyltransferase [Flectobacillus roseus]|uniref:putative colanic acid biosynthesis acetyltransferase n=1 Tax=Flectobacillus roseus TaxID=502259 RepID=UPI0024B77728|nr:putative colanic acid biosynthesis acetyltransferase [Flectobacillus roseus]MDI9872479.1 putative colanic acid biosynthesis acetyltransferase [Flectobacillus roseus]